MLTFLIPTAKELTLSKNPQTHHLAKKSQAIVKSLQNLSTDDLITLYKIKENKAQEEYEHLKALSPEINNAFPAIELFNGLMYRHIKRTDLSTDEKNYLKNHVVITSSLYGIIPAYYPIAPHRLDFNVNLKVDGKSLKNYWRADYDHFAKDKDNLISLLSSEFEAVFSPNTKEKLISLKFLEDKNGCLKSHSTISKKARGQFLSQAITTQCQSIDDLKALTFENFHYRSDLSTEKLLVFVKNFP